MSVQADEPRRIDWIKLSPWLYTIGLFAIWEIAVRLLGLPAYVLPAPTATVAAAIEFWPAIWKNGLQTLMTTLAGFALAVVGGLLYRRATR